MLNPWYDLKSVLAKELGETLIHWSKNMHSHPGQYEAEEYSALLYMHGCTLLRYGDNRCIGEATNYLLVDKIAEANGFNWELISTSPDGFFIDEDEVAGIEAKASLQWVTENFHTLWD